jgi:PAS domain S-box-containing protein
MIPPNNDLKNPDPEPTTSSFGIKQIVGGFLLVNIIFLFVGTYALVNINKIGDLTSIIHRHPLEAALRANTGVFKMHRSMKDVVLSDEHLHLETAIQRVEEEEKEVFQNLEIIKDLILGAEGQQLEKVTRELFIDWKPIRAEVISLVKNHAREKAVHINHGKGARHMGKIGESMQALTSYARKKADGFIVQALALESRVAKTTAILIASGIITSLFIAFIVIKNLMAAVSLHTKTEEELSLSETKYRALVEQSISGIYMVQEDRIVFGNKRFCEIFGYSEEELLTSVAPLDLVIEEDRDLARGKIEQRMKGDVESTDYQVRGRRKDGSIIWLDVHGSGRLMFDGEYVTSATVLDITDRIKSEQALAESEARFHAFMDASPTITCIKDEKGRYLYMNKSWSQAFDIKGEEGIGKTPFELFPPELADKIRTIDLDVLRTNKPIEAIVEPFELGDRQYYWHYVKFPLQDGSGQRLVGSIAIDITKQVQVEIELKNRREHIQTSLQTMVAEKTAELKVRVDESEQLNRAMANLLEDLQDNQKQLEATSEQLAYSNKELEGFSYSVSHDLRAPLRHMSGFTSLLEKHAADSFDDKSKRYISIIRDSAEKMGQLIDDLLHYSRTGRAEMQKQSVKSEELVHEVIKELEAYNEGRQIDWLVGQLPPALADPALLRIIWTNLLSNAVKFTGNRDKASIEIGSIPGEKDETVYFVKDNGAGFDMKYQDKLFGVFQRLHRDSEFEGTGIGLATVQRIIHRHGGHIWTEGAINEGATFFFTLS